MSPLQFKLQQAAYYLVVAREDRMRLALELEAALRIEDHRHYELKTALEQFKKSAEHLPPVPNKLYKPVPEFGTAPDRTSQSSDATQTLLDRFNGVRD